MSVELEEHEFDLPDSKIILYGVPSKEPFYAKFGFSKMKTAMALFKDQARVRDTKLIES